MLLNITSGIGRAPYVSVVSSSRSADISVVEAARFRFLIIRSLVICSDAGLDGGKEELISIDIIRNECGDARNGGMCSSKSHCSALSIGCLRSGTWRKHEVIMTKTMNEKSSII
jgi:hypothetical protein